MAALIVSAFVILIVVLALVFLLHRAKGVGLLSKGHSRYVYRPGQANLQFSFFQSLGILIVWNVDFIQKSYARVPNMTKIAKFDYLYENLSVTD